MTNRFSVWLFWWAVVAILLAGAIGFSVAASRLPASQAYAASQLAGPLPGEK